jgi:glycosyltransferase involved in cell wall biosynthesis
LLENKEYATKLGRQGRERVLKEFNWDNFTTKIFNLVYN